MSDARDHDCCSEAEPASALCPVSSAKGKTVDRMTPASLLVDPSRLGAGPFYFCPDPGCEVVYFAASGDETYRKADLKVRVGLKETEDPVPVCYCFDFTRANLREEVEQTGATTIPQQIKDGIAAGQCACEVKNPQGICCLGDVNAAVHAIQVELQEGAQEEPKS
ncbi:MAG: (2Fe-2S)-binding protein [Planctomycetota bacterium]